MLGDFGTWRRPRCSAPHQRASHGRGGSCHNDFGQAVSPPKRQSQYVRGLRAVRALTHKCRDSRILLLAHFWLIGEGDRRLRGCGKLRCRLARAVRMGDAAAVPCRSRPPCWHTPRVGTGPLVDMDTVSLEDAAELALTSFCWWRADLSRDVCEAYWRDVHGIMFARVPGLWQYRQLRLDANRPDLWPTVPGLSFHAPGVAQPQGMPHGLFLCEADLVAFGNHALPQETIPNDAHNFIGRIGALLSPPNSGHTLIDRINDPAMQGPPPVPTFVLCFVPRSGAAATEEFHHYLTEHVARPWSEHPDVLRLRVEPLPPYEESAMSSPGVPYQWPNDETYLGWIELAVRNEGVLGELLASLATDVLVQQVRALHTYPIREIYTIISAGRPTGVGLRGYPAVQMIIAAGADNQHSDEVLNLLFGNAVRGLDQLRRQP